LGEVGSQSRVWVGSEVLAPRRKLPTDLPGHRQGTAEPLSRGSKVAGFRGAPLGKDEGTIEQDRSSLDEAGVPGVSESWEEKPLSHKNLYWDHVGLHGQS
jgi:hypothetical protein